MKIGVGIDERLGLSLDQQRELVQAAARLGYESLWTPASATGRSALLTCLRWWQGVRETSRQEMRVGISVVPSPAWTVPTLAAEAASVNELTDGSLVLGIGLGAYASPGFRKQLGISDAPPVAFMRDQVKTLRGLFAGEQVTHEGKAVQLHSVQLGIKAPKVPVYLAALNPVMLRAAGELADGLTPNWTSAEHMPWLREQLEEGVRKAGRQAGSVPIAQYIRVCVDEDEAAARRAFVANMLGYAMARPGQRTDQGYRSHFGRMGFEELLQDLERRRDGGTPMAELVELVPAELALKVGYFGKASGAAAALGKLSKGLDEAMVRLISVRQGDLDASLRSIEACQPSGWR
jgi:alkanesulfonate monooxygenase SsuD/methylene tetrahydromethanopterin reductase-like flavin-dependent oxidoreductase (luciferase family)